jgi:hypothetical protein
LHWHLRAKGAHSFATIPSQVPVNGEGKLGKRKLSDAESSQPLKKMMVVSGVFCGAHELFASCIWNDSRARISKMDLTDN